MVLLVLLDTYVRLYREIKSDFTLGFIMFSAILLLQNIAHAYIVLPLVIESLPLSNPHILVLGYTDFPAAIIPDALEFIALCVLLYLARK